MAAGAQYAPVAGGKPAEEEGGSRSCCCWLCFVANALLFIVVIQAFDIKFYADKVWSSTTGYKVTLCSKSTDGCRTAVDFPGYNLLQKFTWQEVVDDLKTLPDRMDSGEAVHLNELGWNRLNVGMWMGSYDITGYDGITLMLHPTDQQFARPVMEQLYNRAGQTDVIKAMIQNFSASSFSVDATSVSYFTQKILHKTTLGMDISDAEAEELVGMQTKALATAPFLPDEFSFVAVLIGLRQTRDKWVKRYEAEILKSNLDIFPASMTKRQLRILADNFADAMTFAGGLSVQQGIVTLLGLLYMRTSPVPADLDPETAKQVVWEALRLYPLVGAIPYWDVKQDRHVWPNIFMALWDERAWGEEPMEFKLRNLSLYEEKAGVAFAEMAKGRGCPGQAVALEILRQFLLLWPRSEFETDDDIQFTNTGPFYPMGLSLRRKTDDLQPKTEVV